MKVEIKATKEEEKSSLFQMEVLAEMMELILSNTCPKEKEYNFGICTFEYDLHCVSIRITARYLGWNEHKDNTVKEDHASYEILSYEFLNFREY